MACRALGSAVQLLDSCDLTDEQSDLVEFYDVCDLCLMECVYPEEDEQPD